MNANEIYKNFLNRLATIESMEEKEYAMIEAYDELAEAGYNEGERAYIWNRMLLEA